MARKELMKGHPANIPDLKRTRTICLLTKATKNNRGRTVYVSKFPPGFTLQIYLVFFSVESICGFTSNFVATCSVTSYPFGFTQKRKFYLFTSSNSL